MHIKELSSACSLALAACLALHLLPAAAQTAPPQGPGYSVTESGAFYSVWQMTVPVTNSLTGLVSLQVHSYTALGDGMNYWTNGQWTPSQDLIEATPTGAVAVHGQITASFGGDITAPGAINLTTPSGLVFRSHPVGLYYADPVSGKVAQVGLVQSGQGLLYPPNVIVFTNALSGPDADLVLVWSGQGFDQSLVIKQSPPAPESFGLSSATCRLQFWSAMDAWPQPVEQRPVLLPSGLVDNLLFFTDCWFPVGSAFAFGATPLPAPGQAAAVRPFDPSDTNAIATAKSIVSIAGQQVLIEEVNYADLAPAFSGLSQAALSPGGPRTVELAARGQLLPGSASPKRQPRPIQVASAPYQARGVMADYTILAGTSNTFTFTNGATFCISNSFTVRSTATLQSGACIKFATNAYLDLLGTVSTPSSNPPAVLTSIDDNAYGQGISGCGPNPNYAARYAIIMSYNDTAPLNLQNLLIRWAQCGIDWEEDPGYNGSVSSSVFQDCGTALLVDMPSDTLSLTNDVCCNVTNTNPVSIQYGTVSGSITTNCGVVSVAMVNDPNQDLTGLDTNKNSESECTFILADNSQTIVAAFSDTHLDEMNFGTFAANFSGILSPRSTWWAVSTNGGVSFTNTAPLPPSGTNLTNSWYGDAPNSAMAYDPSYPSNSYGTIYLLANCSREPTNYMGFRLWTSTNYATNFSLLNTNVPGGAWGVSNVDRPMIKVNRSTHDLYVAGGSLAGTTNQGAFAAHSASGGTNWDLCQVFDTYGTFCDIVITPGGVVYVTWVAYPSAVGPYTNTIRYAWLMPGSNSWSGPSDFGITLNSTLAGGQRQALRFKGDTNTDWFETLPFPRTTFANGHLYLVYSDLPSTNSTTDQGDIFLAEAATNSDGSLTLTGPVRRVNNDRTATDQWDPAITVKPGGTELFIGYYSRQNDPSNSLIMAYGAKGDIASGLSNATFDCFPVSTNSFPPLFGGATAASNLQFDVVYPVPPLCLDSDARADCVAIQTTNSGGKNVLVCLCDTNDLVVTTGWPNWFQDDNTWADADSNYFYYAWCDRSRTWTNTFAGHQCTRPDADVKLAKIRQ
jgi:hypothetical protein